MRGGCTANKRRTVKTVWRTGWCLLHSWLMRPWDICVDARRTLLWVLAQVVHPGTWLTSGARVVVVNRYTDRYAAASEVISKQRPSHLFVASPFVIQFNAGMPST